MANQIQLILDTAGTPMDISDYIMQQTDIVETPIYTEGAAAGTSKVGTPIYDRLQTLYTFSVPLKPDLQAVYAQIEAKVKGGAMYVEYTSFRDDSNVTMYGLCSLSQAQYVQTIDRNGQSSRVYAGSVLTFEGYERP